MMRRAEYQSGEAQGHLSRVEALIAQSNDPRHAQGESMRFGRETGLALLKLKGSLEASAASCFWVRGRHASTRPKGARGQQYFADLNAKIMRKLGKTRRAARSADNV